MFTVTISRYDRQSTNSERFEVQIPTRVTVTGKEDHFARAVEDVDMILRGMRELDRLLVPAGEEGPIYRVHSIADR